MHPNTRTTNLQHELVPAAAAAHSSLAVSSAAVTTAAVTLAARCRYVEVQVGSAPVLHTYNGTTPTATGPVGFNYPAGTIVLMTARTWAESKFVRASGVDALLQVGQME